MSFHHADVKIENGKTVLWFEGETKVTLDKDAVALYDDGEPEIASTFISQQTTLTQ